VDAFIQFYGRYEEARDLFGKEKDATGITFLDEGIHTFRLHQNTLWRTMCHHDIDILNSKVVPVVSAILKTPIARLIR
jgi:hypothetical protein